MANGCAHASLSLITKLDRAIWNYRMYLSYRCLTGRPVSASDALDLRRSCDVT